MADIKISQLPAATTPLTGTEEVPLVQSGTTKKATVSEIVGSISVTGVTATAPVVSSGGNTPNISMAAATASVSGYLTSSDWSTFNSKQPAGSYLTNGGALGTPSSGTATNLTGLPLSTGVTGTLPVANGGTGTATPNIVAGTNVTVSGTWPNQTINAAGSGDVSGPASSTDNAVARFDSTTGKIIQNSGVVINDTGEVTVGVWKGTEIGLSYGGTGASSASQARGNILPSYSGNAGKILAVNVGATDAEWVAAGGSGTVTSVDVSGGTTGLTTSGGPITAAGTITLGGTLAVANGGTGTATPALVAGTNVTITGTWPNQTINASGGGGSGDVVGPSSATDNAIARFDGTTGKLIQNSAVTIADDGATVISTSSASDALRITQTGAGNAILVEDSANPDSTPFVINASGQVVVGYTAPLAIGDADTLLQTHRNGSSGLLATRWSSNSFGPYLNLGKSRGADVGTYAIVQSGDTLGTIQFCGDDGTDLVSTAAQIRAEVDGTPGTNDMPGRLAFSTTADGASSPTERMRIDSAGNVGIGVTPNADVSLHIQKNITGGASAQAVRASGTFQSDVTFGRGFNTVLSTAATSFTLPTIHHYAANQGTIGAGSTVTDQYGFLVAASLIGATNNYGFRGLIPSGANRYNLYMDGTANNYLAGNVGIGSVDLPSTTLHIQKSTTGATTSRGVWFNSTVASDVTLSANAFQTSVSTQAAAFTLTNLRHFYATQGTIGATSTLTNQFGFFVDSTLTGATNNYGFYSNIASGTGRWNFYAAGTAQNYFAGNVGIATTSPGSALDVKGTLRLSGSSSGYVGFAPAAAAGSTTYTLPSADGSSGQVLSTNGSGTLSWATGGGGGSAATPTALGTVYGSMTTSGASPYLTALGYNAGAATTGARNVFVGVSAGEANVTGVDSIAIGYQAMQNYTGADGGNIAIGTSALSTATSGSSYYNVAIGYEAMKLNTSGYNNVAMGWRALLNNTSGRYSVAIGYNALRSLTTGNDGSTAVGASALDQVTTGIYNVGCGGSAIAAVTTGSYNTALGYNALGPAGTTSSSNTAIGYNAMSAGGVKSNNTAVGREALAANTTGSSQTAVGYLALNSSTGAENTAVGTSAGAGITSGTGNVICGPNSGGTLTTGASNIYVGNAANASGAAVNKEILIGWNTTGKGSSTGYISPDGGGVYQGNNASTWSTTSDQRLKKNIADNNDGLDKINSIRVRNFEYRLPEEVDAELKPTDAVNRTGVQLGVIAQELQAVLPECVKTESTGVMSVDTDNLTWYLVNAVKQLKAEFDAYKASHP